MISLNIDFGLAVANIGQVKSLLSFQIPSGNRVDDVLGDRIAASDTSADLALIHIDGASGLPVAQLGKSVDVQVGDDVVAIGNALALKGGLTVTLPSTGASRVTVKLSGGRIQASKSLKRKLRHRKSTKLTLSLTTVDTQGRHNALRVKFTGRR